MRTYLLATLLLAQASCGMLARKPPDHVYYVFFTERSAALDPPAAGVIAKAAAAAMALPGAQVSVHGYTDRAGNRQADVELSQRRAERVADALAKAGLSPVRIVPEGQGQAADATGVENRRVEITIER